MAGVRQLHAEIRAKGESRDLLSALAIGYANLGSLVDFHNSAAHKVYYARAMLYPERLSKQTNDTPWSLLTSAYVAAQIGMPDAAMIWIDQAKKKMTDTDRPLPWFADVLDKFSHGDLRGMMKSIGSAAGALTWRATSTCKLSASGLSTISPSRPRWNCRKTAPNAPAFTTSWRCRVRWAR